MSISLIDQVWLRLVNFCDILVRFHHFKASVSLPLDFLFHTLRLILWIDYCTIFLAVGRSNYTLSRFMVWIKSCEPFWLLLKWKLIQDVSISIIAGHFFLFAILIFVFLWTCHINENPYWDRAYTHYYRSDTHQHYLSIICRPHSGEFLIKLKLLKDAIERVEGVLRVRDLRYNIQNEVHLSRPLEIKSFHQRDHLDVVGENTDQNRLRLVPFRLIEQIANIY